MEVKSPPGVHWMQPFVTQVASIRLENRGRHSVRKLLKMSHIFFSRLTPETRTMDPMVCTTRDGVRNVFRDVQVIIKSLLCERRLFCNPLCCAKVIQFFVPLSISLLGDYFYRRGSSFGFGPTIYNRLENHFGLRSCSRSYSVLLCE